MLVAVMCAAFAGQAWGDTTTYQHVFNAKPSTGSNITLSGVSWTIAATNLGSYNSGNYAGVQLGSSKNNGSITLTSSSAWGSVTGTYYNKTKITEVRLWLNLGGTSVTPTVTIGGKAATSDGTTVVKNSSAGSDWTKATKVTFTPAADGNTGVVVINVATVKAGYICCMEIDCEEAVTNYAITKSASNGTISTQVNSSEVTEAAEDATVTITATPNTGYSFSSWNVTKTSGGAEVSVADASANPTTFTMPAEAVTVAATFTINSHNLVLTTTNGTCAVTVDGDDWDDSSAIAYGAAVEITATPSSGYLFDAWDHTLTSPTISSNVISFSMPDEDVIIEAQYVDASSVKAITISDAIEHGTVTANVNTASAGDEITLTATPDEGYAFGSWNVVDEESNTVTVTNNKFTMPDAEVTVSATFTEVVAASVSLDITSTTIYLGATTATLTPTVLPANTLNKDVTWESSDESVATVSNGVVTPVAVGTATITVKTANNQTATCVVTVATAPKGSQYDPFTCAEAIAAYDNAGEKVNDKYVKGIVTKISGSNYWISDDGVVDNEQFECYNGKQEDGTTAINSTYLNVGDVVVAHGNITLFSTTYELEANNVVYSKTRPVVTVTRNNDSYGTASLTTRTITATPADGYRLASPAYSVTSGEASVTDNGDNTLTLSGIWDDCTVQVNFEALPTHTVTFYCNGSTVSSASVAEGSAITFPAAVATPSAGQIPEEFNSKTFLGWFTTEYTHATDAPAYVNSANMGNADVTYYAVYANVTGSASWVEATLASMTSTDVFVFASGTYAMKNDGGTSGSPKPANITVSDGKITSSVTDAMKWKVSGNSTDGYTFLKYDDTTKWLYCNTTASSSSNDNLRVGTGDRKLWIYQGSYLKTNDSNTARYLSMNGTTDFRSYVNTNTNPVTPTFYKYQGPTYSNYTTDARAEAGISFANASVDAQLKSGYIGQVLTNPNLLTVSCSSSDPTVATVNSSTGAITELLKAGTTTITATFAGNATYKAAVASYTLNVTEKTPAGLTYAVTEVAKSYGDKNFTNALSNPNNLDGVTYGSSNTGVATVDEDGEVTIKTIGSTTITASFAGNATYAAGNASYTLTVSKATPTLSFAAANITGHIGEAVSANALTNPANLTVSYSSSDGTVATVNSSGVVANPLKAGTTTITASFIGNDNYFAGEASYTLKVLANPTISVSDDDVDYGKTYTFDASALSSYGAVTLTSGNTAIATVDGLVITPVACGTVTITVSTAENEDYRDGSATFNLTINAPTGSTTADELIASFDFTDNTDWGLPTSETSTTTSYNNGVYEITLAGAHYFQSTNKYLMLKGNTGVLTFPEFDKSVTKIEVVGKSGASTTTKENIYVESTAVSTETTGSTGTNTFAINSNYQDVGTIYSLKVTDKNAQITRINVYTSPASPTVTLNANGFLAYASQNPMDFSSVTGFTAWQATDVSGSTITFEKITGKIKGGQGVLLKGTANAEVTIPLADSENVLEDNLLKATLAPTYFADETIYGLKGDAFYLNNPCTLKANRAYFNAEDVTSGGSLSKSFTFIFEDPTTGITEPRQATREEVESIFNLGGQRLQKLQRGINIVNGKKVLVK